MAKLGSATVTLEIEPIVKITCVEVKCKFNLAFMQSGYYTCNLKHVTIGPGGQCRHFENATQPDVRNGEQP